MILKIGHIVNGTEISGSSNSFADVFNPATGEVQAKVSLATSEELDEAVTVAKCAQPKWAAINPQKRARVFMNFVALLHRDMDKLACALSTEHGKTIPDARGDIIRGLEVAEFCIGAPHLLKGEYSDGVGTGIDMYSMRQPLGVVAGITPFNFPAMIPMWKFCPAIAAGNAFILKPSERTPTVPIMLCKLMQEAGLPNGVLQVLNGDKSTVDAILDHQDIAAIGFVGSTQVAQYIYSRAANTGKRAQCFGSAKNHMIIMPDANLDQVADALIGASFGAAGERCMAISLAVPVGNETADRLIEKLIPKIKKLKIGPFNSKEEIDFGPLITRAAEQRARALIKSGIAGGAKLLVDGRDFKIPENQNGFFMGACLFDYVTHEMEIYNQEIFAPVLCISRVQNYKDALALVMDNEFGNGASIYTRDGDTARDLASRINVGMVGINVPIPVPLAHYTFGGWKKSGFGDINQHGPDSFRFYTRTKTVTSRWPSGIKDGADFPIPVMN